MAEVQILPATRLLAWEQEKSSILQDSKGSISDNKEQDLYRLENLHEYLTLLHYGPEASRIKAIDSIEHILVRIHNTYAIAWDFGGVLMDGHNKFFIELYARSKGVDLTREQSIYLWQVIFKSKPLPGVNYDALKIGQATPEQFASHAIAQFNAIFMQAEKSSVELNSAEIQNFLTLYYSHYDPKHENREILQRLHQMGIRQYGLTNNFMAKIEYFLEQPEFDYLRWLIMIVSEKFGASKPHPKIYRFFKQHVFLDRFARKCLHVRLSDRQLEQFWQTMFQDTPTVTSPFTAYQQQQMPLEQLCEVAIAQCNRILLEAGQGETDRAIAIPQLADFWNCHYDRIAHQTIFVDDKVKNLNQAFQHEGMLGVQYDANQGQTLAAQPVIRELLGQEQLKQVVRQLRECATDQTPLGVRAKQALDRLMLLRIRHEKRVWQSHPGRQQQSASSLSDPQIHRLLQRHVPKLYKTHLKLGQLVSQQYGLIHRLARLPEYTYDEARQVVLELFETSDLFLDQNRDLYPWQETAMPEVVAPDLGDLQERESLLKKRLLPELKRKIFEFVTVLDVTHQPEIQQVLGHLQTAEDLETVKHVTDQLVQQLTVLKSGWVAQPRQVEQLLETLQKTLNQTSLPELPLVLRQQMKVWHQRFSGESQQTWADVLPLQRLVMDWEQEIHQLESTYFQQYYRWKTLKDEERLALYEDPLLEDVRDRFSEDDLYQFVRGLMLQVYDMPRWKDLTKPTIILVSGASGSGKSTLSCHLARNFGIQKVFSTDETGRANSQAMLNFLLGPEVAAQTFPALYQSSFEGDLQSYYYQTVLTSIGVEGLIKRLHKQNTSALIEGVGLMPGLFSKTLFELLNIDWIVLQVERQQHYDHFTRRSQSCSRAAQRYQDGFDMIREIHDRMIERGLKHELTLVENSGPIRQAIEVATERIKGPFTSQFMEIHDPIREAVIEQLSLLRQHLPVKVHFDVKRASIHSGMAEQSMIDLLQQFGFAPLADQRHQWMRQRV